MRFGADIEDDIIELPVIAMIDVIFNLLLFFMACFTVADMVANPNVMLPAADHAANDDNPPPDRLVINVERDGNVTVGAGERDDKALLELIRIEAKLSRDKNNPLVANRTVLIRVDEQARFEKVQRIMTMCTDSGLWKLSFAAASTEELAIQRAERAR